MMARIAFSVAALAMLVATPSRSHAQTEVRSFRAAGLTWIRFVLGLAVREESRHVASATLPADGTDRRVRSPPRASRSARARPRLRSSAERRGPRATSRPPRGPARPWPVEPARGSSPRARPATGLDLGRRRRPSGGVRSQSPVRRRPRPPSCRARGERAAGARAGDACRAPGDYGGCPSLRGHSGFHAEGRARRSRGLPDEGLSPSPRAARAAGTPRRRASSDLATLLAALQTVPSPDRSRSFARPASQLSRSLRAGRRCRRRGSGRGRRATRPCRGPGHRRS